MIRPLARVVARGGSAPRIALSLASGAALAGSSAALAMPYFNPRIVSSSFGTAPAVATGDIDGDGAIDVVAASTDSAKLSWLRNEGGALPMFVEFTIDDDLASPASVAIANLGGSALLDVVIADAGSSAIMWFEQSPGSPPTWTKRVVSTTVPGAAAVVIADIDGDSDPDLVAAAETSNTVYWFENNGANPPVFTRRTVTSLAVGCSSVAVADLNGDTRRDIVCYNAEVPALFWFENMSPADGASLPPTFTQHVVGGAPTANGKVAIAALNADAFPDVVLATPTGFRWFENNPASPGMFAQRLITFNLAAPSGVATGDVNNDGRTDVALSFDAGKGVAWYENDGTAPTPSFIERIVEANATRHGSVAVVDLDDDEDTDIVAGDLETTVLHWYEQGAPDLAMRRSTFDGGGGTSAAVVDSQTDFVLSGTIGQHDAGGSAGGVFEVRGGFWLAPGVAPCSGDTNGDRVVDFLDLNNVLSDFGVTAPGLAGDVNHDGVCDFIDLNIVLGAFGTSC